MEDGKGSKGRNLWEWVALGTRAALIALDWLINRKGPDR